MGNYAFYIVSAYGLALAIFVTEIALVRHKRKITLQQLRNMQEAEQDSGEME